jgi:hypothetical protein
MAYIRRKLNAKIDNPAPFAVFSIMKKDNIGLHIVNMPLPEGCLARPGSALINPTSITLHCVGAYPNLAVTTLRYWWMTGSDGKGRCVSSHFIIKDNDCIQCLPTDEVAWHMGVKPESYSSIGIELLPENRKGMFSTRTLVTLKALVDTLPPLPIKRHFDWTGDSCPMYYTPAAGDGHGQERWEAMLTYLESGR